MRFNSVSYERAELIPPCMHRRGEAFQQEEVGTSTARILEDASCRGDILFERWNIATLLDEYWSLNKTERLKESQLEEKQ